MSSFEVNTPSVGVPISNGGRKNHPHRDGECNGLFQNQPESPIHLLLPHIILVSKGGDLLTPERE